MDDKVIEVSKQNEKRKNEKGAIFVEALLSLTFFIFAMFTMLSLIQIAYTQARMNVALGCATKELAQYMHIYYEVGLDNALSATGGKSSELLGKVGELVESVGGEIGSVGSELSELSELFGGYGSGFANTVNDIGGKVEGGGSALKDDSVADIIKSVAIRPIIKRMLYNELKTDGYTSGEEFIQKNRIENLSFSQSSFMENGSDNIYIQATYDVRVIQLLNIDFTFHMSSWAYTTAWGG